MHHATPPHAWYNQTSIPHNLIWISLLLYLSAAKRLNLPTFGSENSENDESAEMGADSVTYHTMSTTNDKLCSVIEIQMDGRGRGRGIGGTDVGSWMKKHPPSPVIFGFLMARMLAKRARMRDRTKPSSQVQNTADIYGSSLQAVKGSLCQALFGGADGG